MIMRGKLGIIGTTLAGAAMWLQGCLPHNGEVAPIEYMPTAKRLSEIVDMPAGKPAARSARNCMTFDYIQNQAPSLWGKLQQDWQSCKADRTLVQEKENAQQQAYNFLSETAQALASYDGEIRSRAQKLMREIYDSGILTESQYEDAVEEGLHEVLRWHRRDNSSTARTMRGVGTFLSEVCPGSSLWRNNRGIGKLRPTQEDLEKRIGKDLSNTNYSWEQMRTALRPALEEAYTEYMQRIADTDDKPRDSEDITPEHLKEAYCETMAWELAARYHGMDAEASYFQAIRRRVWFAARERAEAARENGELPENLGITDAQLVHAAQAYLVENYGRDGMSALHSAIRKNQWRVAKDVLYVLGAGAGAANAAASSGAAAGAEGTIGGGIIGGPITN